MGSRDGKSLSALGFLTVVAHEPHGLFGGLLLVDEGGRPLEFHCTAPVRTNRAQEILFGSTLESYLYGEQIGRTLVESAKQKPAVICTDRAAVLAVREHIEIPVTLVRLDEAENDRGSSDERHEPPGSQSWQALTSFTVGDRHVAVLSSYAADQGLATQRLAPLAKRLDLAEPFVRIREAIDEAQRSGR